MIKTLLSFAFIFVSYVLFAQIEITGDTYTNAGTVLNTENAAPSWSLATSLQNMSGENQTWDASDWEGVNPSDQSFVSVSGAPFAYQFFFNNQFLYPETYSNHSSSVNVEDMDLPLPFDVGDPYSFFRNDGDGYFTTGTAFTMEGLPVITQYDIPDQILTFPMVYGNVDTTFSEYLTEAPLLGAYGQKGSRISNVDGWGTLVTPDGIFEVLRVSAVRNLVDTIYVEQFGFGQVVERPIQTDYMWISAGVEGPLLQMSVVNGVVVSAQLNRENESVGLNEGVGVSLSLFPNPTSGTLSINAEGIEYIRMCDMAGRFILQQKFDGGQNQVRVDLTELVSGPYLIEVDTRLGKAMRKVVKE